METGDGYPFRTAINKSIRQREEGRQIRVGITLKPTETDQTGQQALVKTFIADLERKSVTKGKAILGMLEGDKKWENCENTPLFIE